MKYFIAAGVCLFLLVLVFTAGLPAWLDGLLVTLGMLLLPFGALGAAGARGGMDEDLGAGAALGTAWFLDGVFRKR